MDLSVINIEKLGRKISPYRIMIIEWIPVKKIVPRINRYPSIMAGNITVSYCQCRESDRENHDVRESAENSAEA